jgi:hypothetical protein
MKTDRRGRTGRAWRQTSADVNVEGPHKGFTPAVFRSDGLRRAPSSEKIDGRP